MIRYLLYSLCLIAVFDACAEDLPTLTVGVENQIYDPHSRYENNELTGFAREVLDAFGEYAGYQMRYEGYPINTLFDGLISRRFDLKYPDNPYWQHELKNGVRIAYSRGVSPFIDGVVVLEENKDMEITKLKRLGLPFGFTALGYQYLAENDKVELIRRKTLSELIELLLKKEIDGIYGNIDVTLFQYEHYHSGQTTLQWAPKLPYTAQSYKLSTAKKPRLIKKFNEFLAAKKQTVTAIRKKYGIKDIIERQQ